MKFLVIGFSEQAQKTLEVLLQLEFPIHSYCSVPRQLSEKYTCLVPNTSAHQQKCDFCIVDLDGIGLSQYSIQARETLIKIINHKPSVLISRQEHLSWARDLLLSKRCVILNHSHTRQELLDALYKIVKVDTPVENTTTTSSVVSDLRPTVSVTEEKTATDSVSKVAEPEIKLPALAERAKLAKRVLSQRWADYHNYHIVERLLDIFSQSSPYWLSISDHKLLIDPQRGTVLIKSLSCVVDYFVLISGFNFSVFKLDVQSLLSEDYTKQKENLLASGYRVYSLNLLIWQIFQEILPHRLQLNTDNLRIKLKYMPNFTALRGVPPYMHALSATCVVTANTFDELKTRFSYVQDEHINRFFFLTLLTDVIDSTMITHLDAKTVKAQQQSINTTTATTDVSSTETGTSKSAETAVQSASSETKPNDGVEKAKKTGFFARLLQKLSF